MVIVSPTNAKDKNRVNIIIKDSNDEVIRRICIDPSLYIRQVKLDISRMKFVSFLFVWMESHWLDEYEQANRMLCPFL